MKITRLESFLTNAGLRNYLFLRLTTDTGLTGVGEASLEWQEQTVQTNGSRTACSGPTRSMWNASSGV